MFSLEAASKLKIFLNIENFQVQQPVDTIAFKVPFFTSITDNFDTLSTVSDHGTQSKQYLPTKSMYSKSGTFPGKTRGPIAARHFIAAVAHHYYSLRHHYRQTSTMNFLHKYNMYTRVQARPPLVYIARVIEDVFTTRRLHYHSKPGP